MADTKITALTAITTVDPAVDVLPIVDVSDTTMAASGTTKKITSNQILGAGGTATLASAAITGDLTVDTNTLKVDSANNRVGIVKTTPAYPLDVGGRISYSGAIGEGADTTVSSSGTSLLFGNSAGWSDCQFFAGGNLQHRIQSAGIFTWYDGAGGTRMTLNSTGLGVGASPSYKLDVSGDLAVNGNENYVYLFSNYSIGNNARVRFRAVGAGGGSGYGGDFRISTRAANNAWNTDVLVVDSSGNLLVGTTSALASGSTFQNLGSARQVLTLKNDDSTSYTLGLWSATTTGDNFFAYFGTETTLTVRGAISYNRAGGLVAYNTTSDYRAKDIIGPVSNSGSLIDSLKVYVGKMKGATVERPMLIAHEAQSVAPYAVTGTKDEVDADGNPKYQQMDVSSFVPLLIAEIQSLRTRVAALEA
jgi:hypothetical protein